ncbi:MAG: DUF1990 family protein [Planctomycetaceae bacterium]
MFQLTHPAPEQVRQWMSTLLDSNYNYEEYSLFHSPAVSGYRHDFVQTEVGRGKQAFEAGIQSFRQWKMFPSTMAEVITLEDKIAVGTVVAVVAKGGGIWSYNACRIFEVIEEETEDEFRYGFTYATLPGHIARGRSDFCCDSIRVRKKSLTRSKFIPRPITGWSDSTRFTFA